VIPGPRKAAILCVALGPVLSAELLKKLKPREVDELTLEITTLGPVSPEEREAVLREFDHMHLAHGYAVEGGLAYAREVLERALGPEQALRIVGRLSAFVQIAPFEFLRRTDPAQITNFIQHEHPQTIALVLAYLPHEVAASVLARLPAELQSAVSHRIATMESTAPEVVREVEQVMERKLASVINQQLSQAGGVESLVEIISNADRSTERHILESLEQRDPGLADEVRKRMFVFEDVVTVEDRDLQLVLREVEKDLAYALKGTASEVKQKIIANLSARAGEMLDEEMGYLGPVPRHEVEEAQTKVVEVIRRLEGEGRVTIGRGPDEELID
jgi:flagellar motor switch protein FliG